MVICTGVHRALQVLPLPSSHHFGTPVSDWEKLGHEGGFCRKVEGGKDFFFTEHHIFLFKNAEFRICIFFFCFYIFRPSYLSFYKGASFACGMSFVFLSYTSPAYFEMRFILNLMIPNIIKLFFCLLALLAASKPTGIVLP